MARFAFPTRPIRRADVLVATLQGLWLCGWMVADLVQRANGALKPPLSVGVILVLLSGFAFDLPFLVGVAKGRRWGFAGMAILSGMGVMGPLMQSFVVRRPVTAEIVAFAVVDAAMVVYCAFRWRQERVARIEAPRTAALRFADALVGALGVAWPLGVAGLLVQASIRRPLRPDEAPTFLVLGLLGASYVAAAVGVVIGRRWGFVSMIVASVFILLVELMEVRFFRAPVPPPEIVVAVYSLAALAYGAARLVWPRLDKHAATVPL